KKSKNGKVTRKFAEPLGKGEEANCKKTVYSNGTNAFPPPGTEAPWNEVTAELVSKGYSLCGLTYDLVLTNLSAFKGGTESESAAVRDFENYVVSSKGGKKDIKGHLSSPLPKELIKLSEEGISKIVA